ncbi:MULTISPECIES: hypothetical protein [Rhizobium/Agrobacterium group]|uniref:hypothetical protein n=1 Tax=Rhizobium/Agrobacterium group TaxID=227290 RepID=UPI001ADC92F1|nr:MULTISPECIES: hypothetical protein [Rhizobium/Agrobacterium group]MBO9112708.1 hypothetical protein [Agrobacterium sp. S2/73]QXZ76196.1 hypothetical protein J5276_24825 [Agrobacterium sp. S7/73]QYA17255.1 hypothetical protein J5284_31890 [Rhizobium sp. AB2/73]UEQ85628.1 hypothetical protein I8E17_32170 [Rhizobium sp. AB2/73]
MYFKLHADVSITCATGTIRTLFPTREGKDLAKKAIALQRRFPSEIAIYDLVTMQILSCLIDLEALPDGKSSASRSAVKDGILMMALTIFLGRPDHVDEISKALECAKDLVIVLNEDCAYLAIKGPSSTAKISFKLARHAPKGLLH